MTISRIEALADAIISVSGYRDPTSNLYQRRNPLGLKQFKDGVAQEGVRTFPSFIAGFSAALFDLKVKCGGKSRAKLKGDNFNLIGLSRSLYMQDGTAEYLVRFLRKALQDDAITEKTELSYFIENTNAS